MGLVAEAAKINNDRFVAANCFAMSDFCHKSRSIV